MSSMNLWFGWLVTYAVHSTILLGATWLLTRHRFGHPMVREVWWKAATLGALVTATIHAFGFQPLGGELRLGRQPSREAAPLADPVAVPGPAVAPRTKEPPAREASSVGSVVAEVAAASVTPAPAPIRDASAAQPAWSSSLGWLVVTAWMALAVILSIGHFFLRWRLTRRIGARRPLTSGPLVDMLQELARTAGLDRNVRLTVASGLSSPVAIGIREICVPRAAVEELEPDQQRTMLAHELAHLRRLDPLWLGLMTFLERALFFQPLNRIARIESQQAAELLCDEWAAEQTGSPITLARCLVKVAEWIDASPRAVPMAGMAEERSQLVDRVRRLVEDPPMTDKPRRRWVFGLATVAIVGTTLLAPKISLMGQDPARPKSAMKKAERELAEALGTVKKVQADQLHQEAVLAAADLHERAAAALARPPRGPDFALRGPRDSWDGRRAESQFADSNGTVVAALVAALKDPHPEVRRAAAQALGNRADRRATTGLVEALKDESKDVRVAAAEALSQIEDSRAIPGLADAAKDGAGEVRRAAIEALSRFESAPADVFLGALKDSDPELRATAARAVGERKDKRAIADLSALLKDAQAEVRATAIQALAEIGDRGAIDAIAAAVKDANPEVRQRAIDALGEFEIETLPTSVLEALNDSNADVRQTAANAVGRTGDRRAVPSLLRLLDDSNADVREAAVSALGEIRDEAAINALVAALKSKDPVVRKAAAEALGQR